MKQKLVCLLGMLCFSHLSFASTDVVDMEGITLGSILRGLLGLVTICSIALLLSVDRESIKWKQVGAGLCMQIALAVSILYFPPIGKFFEFIGRAFVKMLDFTRAGSTFLLGDLVDITKSPYIFLFQVLPIIVFFSALTGVFYYFGIIQKVVVVVAWVLRRVLGVSGAEGLTVAGNVFLGQTEAPLLIKKYLPHMNVSEVFLVMTVGMATIAGSVLGAYIGLLGEDDPQQRLFFAKHLISASVMAAPGAIILAKIIMPQTESIEMQIEVSRDSVGKNLLDVISNGTMEGVRLAVYIAGMLLVFIAMIAMVNYLLESVIGRYTGLNDVIAGFHNNGQTTLSLEYILGLVFMPFAYLIGVAGEDMHLVASLIGKKLIMNEFVAYVDLATLKDSGAFVYQKSIVMSTYILCGFANFGSIGIIIAGIGTIAPTTRPWLTEHGVRAMLAGTLASCLSATIVGVMV